MAKKNKKAEKLSSRLGDLAEELGTFLGSSERKASEWLARQQELRTQLSAIRDKATALLSQLGPGRDVKEAKGTKGGKEAKGGKKAEKGKKARGGRKATATAAAKKPAKKAARSAVKKPAPIAPAPGPDPIDLEGNDE
jgi:hypothetical protein